MRQKIINLFLISVVVIIGGIVAGFWSIESVHTFIKNELIAVVIIVAIAYYLGIHEIIFEKHKKKKK
jgi:hypothetical protein